MANTSGSGATPTGKASATTTSANNPPTTTTPGTTIEPAGAANRRRDRREDIIQKRRTERIHYRERQSRRRMINLASTVLAVLVVLGAVGWIGLNQYRNWQGQQRLNDVVVFDEIAGFQHQDGPIEYDVSPPVGGPHNNLWQTCQFYDFEIAPWHAVHSLEHGAVWITYGPDASQSERDRLRRLADERDFILISEYPDNPAPIVATAWGHQLYLDDLDDPGLDAFIAEYRRGPQTPEPGATCGGGVESPRQV